MKNFFGLGFGACWAGPPAAGAAADPFAGFLIEVKEVLPGSVAAAAGVPARVRSLDGASVAPLVLTEINGRPLNLFSKEGEAWERLAGGSRDPSKDISVLLQPADIVAKFKKQLKSVRSYKDFLLG